MKGEPIRKQGSEAHFRNETAGPLFVYRRPNRIRKKIRFRKYRPREFSKNVEEKYKIKGG